MPTATKKRVRSRRVLTATPTDWSLTTIPVVGTPGSIAPADVTGWNHTNLPAKYLSLKKWADTNKLEITPLSFELIRYNDWSEVFVWTSFTLTKKITPKNDRVFGAFECACGEKLSIGTVFCAKCSMFQSCNQCYVSGLKLHGVSGSEDRACARCAKECSNNCGNLVAGGKFKECVTCCPREACGLCKEVFGVKDLKTHNSLTKLCNTCYTTKVCSKCNKPDNTVAERNINNKTKVLCNPCTDLIYEEERKAFEKWDETELPTSGNMVLPSSEHRPIRTISVETEFNGSWDKAAKALYQAGLISAPSRENYSTQGVNGKFPCILKGDSTVTGGELVSYLLDMDNENHAAALLRMTEVMRGVRETGYAQFTKNAGGHIHIDLHGFSIGDLWAYYTINKFQEMTFYYIAGAGADYGHRSLAGNSYGNPPSVGPFGSKKAFLLGMRGQGRTGISVSNYVGNAAQCRCGAYGVSEWKTCTCDLGKATSEWRLWNAEINPRILHAWIAIMQSVTAYAMDMEEVNEANFPYLEWKKKHFTLLTAKDKSALKERLEWIHTELPLTHDERDSIIYACKKSELIGLGERFLDGLINLESTSSFSTKTKPRNPYSRKDVSFSTK